MSDDQQEKTLGQMLDEDKGFITARRFLMALAILLLVSAVGGASIKEANTFFFKVEFLNPKALKFLLFLSVVGCVIRYYSFAYKYHSLINKIWHDRLLKDWGFFGVAEFSDGEAGVCGLLGKKRQVLFSEHLGLQDLKYKTCLFFRRSIEFDAREENEENEVFYYRKKVSLNTFDNDWKLKHLLATLKFEFKHRFLTLVQHREYLDVLFPYWVAGAAVISYMLVTFFPAEFTSLAQRDIQQLWLPRST